MFCCMRVTATNYETIPTLNKKSSSTNCRCGNRYTCSASVTIDKEQSAVLYSSANTCTTNFNKSRVDSVIDECKKKLAGSTTYTKNEKEFSYDCDTDINIIPVHVSKKYPYADA